MCCQETRVAPVGHSRSHAGAPAPGEPSTLQARRAWGAPRVSSTHAEKEAYAPRLCPRPAPRPLVPPAAPCALGARAAQGWRRA